jgi:TetR/AcrR family transcriptional repressor of nem operon
MPGSAPASTADLILDVAERLVQVRGYNGFSYADIAAELEIQKASIHYHFPTKHKLGKALVARYRERFLGALAAIAAATPKAPERLRRYAGLWSSVLRDRDRMCLCGMMAADCATLPRAIREELRRFFDHNELWLAGTLAAGRKARTLRFSGPPDREARVLTMAFEGAMLIARSYGDPARFEEAVEWILASLGVTRAAPR